LRVGEVAADHDRVLVDGVEVHVDGVLPCLQALVDAGGPDVLADERLVRLVVPTRMGREHVGTDGQSQHCYRAKRGE
jgi:hypothetical protein